MTLLRTACLLACATLAACGERPPAGSAPAATPAAPAAPAAPVAAPAPAGDVVARHDCEGQYADLLRGGRATRVLLSDGRSFELGRVADSTPPTFMGNGLVFTRPAQGVARLDDETGRSLACAPVPLP